VQPIPASIASMITKIRSDNNTRAELSKNLVIFLSIASSLHICLSPDPQFLDTCATSARLTETGSYLPIDDNAIRVRQVHRPVAGAAIGPILQF
jgi:hypothetical protein